MNDNRKIFYKSEAAARRAERRSGLDYVPVTIVRKATPESPEEATRQYVENHFLQRLFKDPNDTTNRTIGETTVRFVHPSPFAIYPLVSVERPGHPPDVRIHVSGEGVSRRSQALMDFETTVAALESSHKSAVEEDPDEEFSVGPH